MQGRALGEGELKRGSNHEQRLTGRNPGKFNGEMCSLTEMESIQREISLQKAELFQTQRASFLRVVIPEYYFMCIIAFTHP